MIDKKSLKVGDRIKFAYREQGTVEAVVIRLNKTTVTASTRKLENGRVASYRVPYGCVERAS